MPRQARDTPRTLHIQFFFLKNNETRPTIGNLFKGHFKSIKFNCTTQLFLNSRVFTHFLRANTFHPQELTHNLPSSQAWMSNVASFTVFFFSFMFFSSHLCFFSFKFLFFLFLFFFISIFSYIVNYMCAYFTICQIKHTFIFVKK